MLFFGLLFWCCQSADTTQPEKPEPMSPDRQESISDTTSPPHSTTKKEVKILPKEDYDPKQWTDILLVDSSVQVDMKYATTDNFVKEKMYDCSRCLLRPNVASAIAEIQAYLKPKGYGLKMLDCFRPRPIQQKLWDKVPNPNYVTPPEKGSMHNRGMAVDLTLVDKEGKELDMGTAFDYFGKEAHHTYTDLSAEILANRKLLKETMESFGFKPIRTEWWHYSLQTKGYALSDYLWECDEAHEH